MSKEPIRCEHFGRCGGCALQDVTYKQQVKDKEMFLEQLFGFSVGITAAQNEFGYRNRVDFIYTENGLSFRKKGQYDGYEHIRKCLLIPEYIQGLFTSINTELQNKNIVAYNIDTHEGFLRYVVFRFSQETKETMLICTTAKGTSEQEGIFLDLLEKIAPSYTSVQWFVNETKTDISIPPSEPKKIFGQKTIKEKIGEVILEYGPHSFFQSNTAVAQKVFEDIKKHVKGETVDVCCGVGAIGLYVADRATTLVGIEQVPEAIDLARSNAKKNNIHNAVFFTNAMKNFVDHVSLHIDTIIVDPPRSGLDKKTMDKIMLLNPETIIYMSCNPKTQKNDLDYFSKNSSYSVTSLQGYDMFPQTPHVETLAILKQK